jgi:hypothetical protein
MSEFRANKEPLVAPGRIDHHIGDMTVTLAADVSLQETQDALGAMDQWIPADGDPQLPVGQLVETNSTGPLRLGYGAWRDLLLGAQFYNGRGELITAGGRTVKNVAGYDLTKFMVGQRGVFGRLVTITTRTYKQPAGALLVTFPPQPGRLHRLLTSPARPQWTLLTADALLCGYLGDRRSIDYYEKTLAELKPRSIKRRTLEQDIEDRARLWRGEFRASVPPAKVSDLIAVARPTRWVADPAFGIVLGSGDEAAIRSAVKALAGTVHFSRGRDEVLGFEVPPGPQRDLLERLKHSFDPDQRLAPLPWQTQST